MATESIKALFAQAVGDPKLQAELSKVFRPADLVSLAKDYGIHFTEEEAALFLEEWEQNVRSRVEEERKEIQTIDDLLDQISRERESGTEHINLQVRNALLHRALRPRDDVGH